MGKREVKRYQSEFKETIKELYSKGKSVKELSSEYGLPVSTVRQWVIYDAQDLKQEALSIKEMKSLKKELLDLKEENEILKKQPYLLKKRNKRKKQKKGRYL